MGVDEPLAMRVTWEVATVWTSRASWNLAAGSVAVGAAMMFVKGTARMVNGSDLSLVPLFGLGATLGLTVVSASILARDGWTWPPVVSGALGLVGVVGALVAVGYVATGTIPETPDAPALVGLSYGVLAAGTFVALLVLGPTIARRRLLRGRWRWVPLTVIAIQFPVFIVAGAVGEMLGDDTVTDGLGMALTGVAWVFLAYSLTHHADGSTPGGSSAPPGAVAGADVT